MKTPALSISCVLLSLVVAVTSTSSIFDTLQTLNAAKFLHLVTLAGLQHELSSSGAYTVLVPTDAAFAKIPAADLAKVMGDIQTMENVAQYHVINTRWHNKQFLFLRHYHLYSVNGHVIRVFKTNTGLHFNQAVVQKTLFNNGTSHVWELEVNCTNGVIYVIDEVLDVPEGTVIDILGNPSYNVSKFLDIINMAQLDRNYGNPTGFNRYTMFAPCNAAVDAMDHHSLAALKNSSIHLRALVEYHVHSGTLHATSLSHHHTVSTTLPNHRLTVTVTNGDIVLDHLAHVLMPDIEAENGVVHVISKVLIPHLLQHIVG